MAVIILNWNGWRDTEECLRSLARISYRNYYVIVVENGSTDGSKQELRRFMNEAALASEAQDKFDISMSFSEISSGEAALKTPLEAPAARGRRLVLIDSKENLGFAGGNDLGIKYALNNLSPDYILLLNSDTLVEKEFLSELVRVARLDMTVGSVQSLLLKPGGDVIDSLGHEALAFGAADIGINSTYSDDLLPGDMEIFGPCAAAALYRSDALKRVGLLDEAFFAIYEDVDLSWRLRLAGFRSLLARRSVVYHKRGISAGRTASREFSSIKSYHSSKNWIMLALRYYPLRYILPQSPNYLRLFGWCISYSEANGGIGEFQALLLSSLRQRWANKRNPLLKAVQERWIKRAKTEIRGDA